MAGFLWGRVSAEATPGMVSSIWCPKGRVQTGPKLSIPHTHVYTSTYTFRYRCVNMYIMYYTVYTHLCACMPATHTRLLIVLKVHTGIYIHMYTYTCAQRDKKPFTKGMSMLSCLLVLVV